MKTTKQLNSSAVESTPQSSPMADYNADVVDRWMTESVDRVSIAINCGPMGYAAGDANLYRYVGNQPTTKTDPSGLVEEDPPRETGHRSGNNPEKHTAAQRARRLQQENAARRRLQESVNDIVNHNRKDVDCAVDQLEDAAKTLQRKLLKGTGDAAELSQQIDDAKDAIQSLKNISIVNDDRIGVAIDNFEELTPAARKALESRGWKFGGTFLRGGGRVLKVLGPVGAAVGFAASGPSAYANSSGECVTTRAGDTGILMVLDAITFGGFSIVFEDLYHNDQRLRNEQRNRPVVILTAPPSSEPELPPIRIVR